MKSLRKRANEPNGNLGKICRPPDGDRALGRGRAKRANEPSGNLGKVCRASRCNHQQWLARLEKQANEPNGNIGRICRQSDYCHGRSSAKPAKRANEPNGKMSNPYRLSHRASRQPSAGLMKRANEPNGSLGKICRFSGCRACRSLVSPAKRANEPNGSLDKICRLTESGRRPRFASEKQRNKAISVISIRHRNCSCVHRHRKRPRCSLEEARGADERLSITTWAPGECRPDRSDDGCAGTSRGGPGMASRRPSACLTRPLTPIRMSAWLERARLRLPDPPASDRPEERGRTMFRVDAKKSVHFCDGLTRRDFLHAGSLTALGLGLPAMQALEASGAVAKDRDLSCILLFLVGGPSQLDTWDMKPEAPEEIRGPFRPIATRVPGIQVSEVFPRLASMMDKVSLVRTVYAHTARGGPRHRPPDDAERPAVLGRDRVSALWLGAGEAQGVAPRHPALCRRAQADRPDRRQPAARPRRRIARQDVQDPFILNADPNDRGFKVPDLLPPDYVTAVREEPPRRSLRAAIDGAVGSFESSADARLLDANFEARLPLHVQPAGGARPSSIAAEPTATRRSLRPHPVRPELPPRPPADRCRRRPVRHREYVRDGVQRDHLGHPRLGAF